MLYLNRYKNFVNNNEMKLVPQIEIPKMTTDKVVVFERGKTRFDILSQTYYGSPFFGFLIRSSNTQYQGLEFDIPNGSLIRIPFPLNSAIELYNEAIRKHIDIEGL